jgi:hypothetical protein
MPSCTRALRRAYACRAERREAGRALSPVPGWARPGEGAAKDRPRAPELFAVAGAAGHWVSAGPFQAQAGWAGLGGPEGARPGSPPTPVCRARAGCAPWTRRSTQAAKRRTAWTRAPRPEGEPGWAGRGRGRSELRSCFSPHSGARAAIVGPGCRGSPYLDPGNPEGLGHSCVIRGRRPAPPRGRKVEEAEIRCRPTQPLLPSVIT